MIRFWVLASIALVACGKSSTVDDGGFADGSVHDGNVDAAIPSDAEVPDAARDGGPPPDGGPLDAGHDAGPIDEPCETPGTLESVACGRCGTRDRFCAADNIWSYGPCRDERVDGCTPGSTEAQACGMCGLADAVCTDACEWRVIGECSGEGTCEPGVRQRTSAGCPAGQTREVLCNDACSFDVVEACRADACPTPGQVEVVACGMCGSQERFCNASRTWEYGVCGGEGTCMPGDASTEACGMCGTQGLRCTTSCQWERFGSCEGEAGCAPGDTRRTSAGCPAGETRLLRCDDACAFVEAEPCTPRVPVDVMLLLDMTGSHATDVRTARNQIRDELIRPLLTLDDVAVGIAEYADFPVSPYGSPSDVPFRGVTIPTTTASVAEAGLAALTTMAGNDGPESGVEALAVLAGIAPHPQAVPFSCPAGRVAGGCWRAGAIRVVVVLADAENHNGPRADGSAGLESPYGAGVSPAPQQWPAVRTAAMAADIEYMAIIDAAATSPAYLQHGVMIDDLGLDASYLIRRFGATETNWTAVLGMARTRIEALRTP